MGAPSGKTDDEVKGVTAARALVALELLSWDTHPDGWVETGAVADVLGTSTTEAAASLRSARRLGLCSRRRSLVHGTIWRLKNPEAARMAEPGEHRANSPEAPAGIRC
jgi:hypothetical protein